MPHLPFHLPGSLGRAAGGGGLFARPDVRYNYAIAGLPFLSAASREHPIIRETAPVRKEQFDNQTIPGEQSLSGWWIRSQQSFHGGAGQLFADPTEDNPFNSIRYRQSRNCNVWTVGEVTLLNAVAPVDVSPVTAVVDMTEFSYGDGTAGVACAAGDDFVVVRAGAVQVIDFADSAQPLLTVTTDGTAVFVATIDGVWSSSIPATPPGTWTWTKQYSISGSPSSVFMAFVKSRLILGVGPAIYELDPTPTSPPAVLPTPKYTSLDAAWVWTGVTESATAIYVVGNAGSVRGAILKFVLEADGEIPTLAGGAIAAQLPAGEVPHSAMGYLGSFVAIGTNKGVRIAVADNDGGLTYGPLLFETDAPVRAWTARDRFVWCTVSRGSDGDSGLYRIDLSTQVAELRFAYAADVTATGDVTDCNAVANLGSTDALVFATGADLYRENPAVKAASGYLQTSRIRYGTLEPKLFKLLRVRGPALQGPLSFAVLDSNDSEAATALFPEGTPPGEAAVASPIEPTDFISLRFILTRDDINLANGGEFWAYQLKALPATPRQRMIQLPLWCFDFEKDSRGVRVGGKGRALQRLTALEDVETSGRSVSLQDFDSGANVQCVIERLSFSQTAPPLHQEGWGGIITLVLRTV